MTPPTAPTKKQAKPTHEAGGRRQHLMDRLGVFAALACAVHCMAAPIVLALAPLIGGVWASPGAHWVFAAISIPAALSLLARNLRGRSVRARTALMCVACAGASLVLLGLFVPGTEWSRSFALEFAAPSWLPGGAEAASSSGCTKECCASVHAGENGARTFTLPLASMVTMAGGALLVVAHACALRRACCAPAAN